MIRVTVSSGNIARKLTDFSRRMNQRTERALLAIGVRIKEDAQARVPKDTFALHNSAYLGQHDYGFKTVVWVSFGRAQIGTIRAYSPLEGKMVHRTPREYVVYVHQNPEGSHPSGEREFLYRAVHNNLDTLAAIGYQQFQI